ncbi:prepilin peptidase [candidate division FCPU426 bacterium]|nr:prepilin peptidase [candidate division FCPU426 bacterium]
MEFYYRVLPLAVIFFIATITDLSRHKVYNWLTFPAMGLGLGVNVAMQGVPGLWFGAAGMLVGGLVFFPAFFWGGMGAGDIKLMAVLGAFTGWVYVVNAALYAALIGGLAAIVLLVFKGEVWSTLAGICRFLRSLLVPKMEIEPLSQKYSLPYAVVISLGALTAALLPPLIAI